MPLWERQEVQEMLWYLRQIVESANNADLFLYPGDQHLFADNSVPSYDVGATVLLLQRVIDVGDRAIGSHQCAVLFTMRKDLMAIHLLRIRAGECTQDPAIVIQGQTRCTIANDIAWREV